MQITVLGGPFDDEDPLQVLRANVELNKEIGRREAVAVRRARMQGLTWSEIAGRWVCHARQCIANTAGRDSNTEPRRFEKVRNC